MGLSASAKSTLFLELSRYVQAGLDVPRAIDSLLTERIGGALRQPLRRIHDRLIQGSSLQQAFTDPAFTKMEQALIGAGESSGRVESVLTYLSKYNEALAESSRMIRRKLIYPIVVAHLAVFISPVSRLIRASTASFEFDLHAYLIRVAAGLGALYVVTATVWLTCWVLARISEQEPLIDAAVQTMPVIGPVRRNSALARFFAAMEMLLSAGVVIPQALRISGQTMRSAMFQTSTNRAAKVIEEEGSPVDDAMRKGGNFPEQVLRGIHVAADTGTLDTEMGRWARFYWEKAQESLRIITDWLPKIIYALVAAGVVVVIFRIMQSYLNMLNQIGL